MIETLFSFNTGTIFWIGFYTIIYPFIFSIILACFIIIKRKFSNKPKYGEFLFFIVGTIFRILFLLGITLLIFSQLTLVGFITTIILFIILPFIYHLYKSKKNHKN